MPSRAKNAVILGAPLALIVFSLAHGLDWLVMHGMDVDNYDAFIQYIVDIRGRWLAVHLVGLFLFPLLGVAIWLMRCWPRLEGSLRTIHLPGLIRQRRSGVETLRREALER